MNIVEELLRDLLDPDRLQDILGRIVQIVVIAGLAFVVTRLSRRIVGRFEERLKLEDTQAGRNVQRSKTLSAVTRGVVSVVIWTLALLTILKLVIPDVGPVLAGAGVAGIAIAFGAQSLVRDFLNGFFVLLEDQYRVGDNLEIDGVTGVVEEFSLRRTALRAFDGTLHHIANGQFQRVSNRSAGWSRAIIDIGVAYNEDLVKVREAFTRAGANLMADPDVGRWVLELPEFLGVERFEESQVTVRAIAKTVPGKQWPVSRVFRQRIKEAFDRSGIFIPFPHRVMIHQSAGPDSSGQGDRGPGAGGEEDGEGGD